MWMVAEAGLGAAGGLWSVESLIALGTLTALEIVLGIDNIVFISILSNKLPQAQRARARAVGLGLALVMRVCLLLGISWLTRLTAELFSVMGHAFTGKDLVLLAGGGFLIAKATLEIHHRMEGDPHAQEKKRVASFAACIAQIVAIDMVFSLDSVITAVGMARHIEIMVVAVVISMGAMLAFAGPISAFIERHPTTKVLALAFLLLIGVFLVVEGFGGHIEKGYIYFAMAFALGVELVNLRIKAVQQRRAAPGGGAHGAAAPAGPGGA